MASVVLGGIISAAISYYFARRSSRKYVREAEELRRLTRFLIELFAESHGVGVKERDPETGEPRKWHVRDRLPREEYEPQED